MSRNPIKSIFNYPPAIIERCDQLGLVDASNRPGGVGFYVKKIVAMIIFGVLLGLLVRYVNRCTTFLCGALTAYALWVVVNWFDALVLDCLWFCHDKHFVIPGTEDMTKAYHDYGFHIKGALIGMLLGIPAALVAGGIAAIPSNNEDKAIRQMCVEIHEQYPMATLQDVYKTCYQDYFGAEHLVNDTASARQYLQKELEECRNTDMILMPKREPTGFRHRFMRVNLACIVDGELTEEQLLALFFEAASKDNAFGESWAEEWQKIESIALQVCPEWADESLQAELRLATEDKHAVRHSEAFRNAYNPHYRIVKSE
jgi:hypothetical protein